MTPPFADDVALLAGLAAAGIDCELFSHPPVFTVAESRRQTGHLPGVHVRNLFLCDRKRTLFLVTVRELLPVDLKLLKREIATILPVRGNLSLAAADRLDACLAVRPGAVSPLALANDTDHFVTFLLDRGVADSPRLTVHPLRNDRSVTLATADMIRWLESLGHRTIILDLP